ncbi:MAG: tyrosine-type recombinase/integrase [Ruminococcus sp.]
MPAYKNKKRGTWYCSFRYKDALGNRKQKKKEGFKTRREALDFERSFLKERAGAPDMSFRSMYNIYIADCETRMRATYLSGKKSIFETKILPVFGPIPVCDIDAAMVRNWQNDLLADPKGYAPTYLKSINNQLSALFNFAVRFYRLPLNPVPLAGPFGKKNADEMDFWTREEYGRFIAEVKKPAARLAFELLFWTGMREGELLALTLNDVDFKTSKISITKSFATLEGEEILNDAKTEKSNRAVVAPRFLLAEIRDYVDRLVGYEPDQRLFYFTKSYLYKQRDAACKSSGVKVIRIHDLRHSHASMLIEMGCSPLLLKERLGHENIQTTLQTYSHLYPDKQAEVVSQLEAGEAGNYAEVLSDFEKKMENEK